MILKRETTFECKPVVQINYVGSALREKEGRIVGIFLHCEYMFL